MQTVYIETSIVSYLRQRPSSQVVMAARQVLTHRWWNDERANYELVTSQYVLDEAAAGDPVLAAGRLQSLDGIPPTSARCGNRRHCQRNHVAGDSASERFRGRTAYGRRGSPSDRLPIDVELSAHRKRQDSAADSPSF
jgi:hypothetical protein